MKERPILFSAPMVRALLDGSKTQTRRPVYVLTKNAKSACFDQRYRPPFDLPPVGSAYTLSNWRHAEPGDRLWVREAWRAMAQFNSVKPSELQLGTPIIYEASRHPDTQFGKLRPSMFMPRWASRTMLEIVSVRVERLLSISEADAIAEGTERLPHAGWRDYGDPTDWCADPISSYRTLWESINGFQSSKDNPWVWAVEFKRITP